MIFLETGRLVIRNFKPSDWQMLHSMVIRYQATEMAAYDRPWPTSEEEIRNTTGWFASTNSYLAVCLKDTGRLIGYIGITPDETHGQRVYELGYAFDANYHGRGYASEACRAVLDHAFNELQADRIIAGTASVNQPSIRLLKRLGFQKTGEEMVSFRKDENGKPIEFLGYNFAILKAEWEQQRKS